MTDIRVIRTVGDYDAMRSELERLLDLDPSKGSPERDRLEVLLVLLAEYESRQTPAAVVDPVDAIRFRLDQLGLEPRDLEPFLGGRSRVSEILARKRPLSIAMIRALHEGLGIPAEALIVPSAPPVEDQSAEQDVPWERFPLREILSRGWITGELPRRITREAAHRLLTPLFASAGTPSLALPALYRRTVHVRGGKEMDQYSLAAWTARVRDVAARRAVGRSFDVRSLGEAQLRGLVQLSRLTDGPRLAVEWLADRGLVVVVEPHLPRTRLDGAAMLLRDGAPVVALTLRHDRLDNFWFTLLHEVGHVLRHLFGPSEQSPTEFYDDLDVEGVDDSREREADVFARESLVPATAWANSAVAYIASTEAAESLADELGVSPSVVAGRVRAEKRNFRLLGSLVGAGQVRRLFQEVE